ncbi:MAG: glycosyltransferase family 4 protein, partial [Patescibacteria group bacterium]
MKIALIESKLNGRGGSQRQAIGYARAFQQLGHEVTLYTIHYDKEKCFSDMLDGLRVVALPGGFQTPRPMAIPGFGFLNYMRYSRAESNAARRLASLIDRDTDILNAHDRVGFRVAVFYKRFMRNIPSVIMMSDILTKSWTAWRKEQFDPTLKRSLQRRFYYWLIDTYEIRKFITPHEGMTVLDNRTRNWARDYFGVQAIVVRSGLDIKNFLFIPRDGCASKRVRVLVAGIFFLHRRYEDVVQAIKLVVDQGYDATLSIVGNYTSAYEYREYQKRLGQLAENLGLKTRVTFYGEVSEEDLRKSYHTHDIYVSPNHLQSWGLAVFEAMASGLPV